jgi:aminopeptidase S
MKVHVFISGLFFLIQAAGPPADSLRAITTAITQEATPAGRRAAVTARLSSLGVQYETQPFTAGTRTGENIVATIPGKAGSRYLLLGAHLDRVPVGEGAVDNGGSCAVLLELISRLKARSLDNATVTVVFFDLEEVGLIGSREYFRALDAAKRPAKAINLDIFGYGDTLFVTASNPGGPLEMTLRDASANSSVEVRSVPMAQYPASDHRTMAAAGIDTLGLALIDGNEIDSIVGGRGGSVPRTLTLIHSANDTITQIREQDMAAAVPVLEKAIRLIDGMQP